MDKKRIIIIGGGVSGLVAACNLKNKKPDYEIILLEKNSKLGGRLYQFEKEGHIVSNGPSWYWMPDIVNSVYNQLNIPDNDKYKLKRLDPQYQIIYSNDNYDTDSEPFMEKILVPGTEEKFLDLIITKQPDSYDKFVSFYIKSAQKYELSKKYIYYPNLNISEYFKLDTIRDFFKLDIFSSYQKLTNIFQHTIYNKLLEWPAYFIGNDSSNISGLFTILTYSMIKDGTYIPEGDGMYEIIKMLVRHAEKLGVTILTNQEVIGFSFNSRNKINSVILKNSESITNISHIISSNDYHNTEIMLPEELQSYTPEYWSKLDLCPNVILFHISLDIQLTGLQFHNLFFNSFEFYVNRTSSELNTAPSGSDTLFILVPLLNEAKGKTDYELYNLVLDKLTLFTKINIRNHIKLKRTFKEQCFIKRFNAFKGNAYGAACNFSQMAIFRPAIKSQKVPNLYFSGQLTVPGPGLPPCMVSGLIASNQLLKDIEEKKKLLEFSNSNYLSLSEIFFNVYLYFRDFISYITHVLRTLI